MRTVSKRCTHIFSDGSGTQLMASFVKVLHFFPPNDQISIAIAS